MTISSAAIALQSTGPSGRRSEVASINPNTMKKTIASVRSRIPGAYQLVSRWDLRARRLTGGDIVILTYHVASKISAGKSRAGIRAARCRAIAHASTIRIGRQVEHAAQRACHAAFAGNDAVRSTSKATLSVSATMARVVCARAKRDARCDACERGERGRKVRRLMPALKSGCRASQLHALDVQITPKIVSSI